MIAGDVHAHRQVDALGLPGLDLGQRSVDHPASQFHFQRVLGDRGQERQGCKQALIRVLPPDQGLGSDHFAAAHVDLGLVVKHELVLD